MPPQTAVQSCGPRKRPQMLEGNGILEWDSTSGIHRVLECPLLERVPKDTFAVSKAFRSHFESRRRENKKREITEICDVRCGARPVHAHHMKAAEKPNTAFASRHTEFEREPESARLVLTDLLLCGRERIRVQF